MVEIHVYGKLRHYLNGSRPAKGGVLVLEPRPGATIESLLAQTGIPIDKINHIFFNSKLLVTRTKTAPYLGYQQTRANLFDWDLKVPVDAGDRIGLFGADMPMLGM